MKGKRAQERKKARMGSNKSKGEKGIGTGERQEMKFDE